MLPLSEKVKAVSAISPSQGLVNSLILKSAAPPLPIILTSVFSVIIKLFNSHFRQKKIQVVNITHNSPSREFIYKYNMYTNIIFPQKVESVYAV